MTISITLAPVYYYQYRTGRGKYLPAWVRFVFVFLLFGMNVKHTTVASLGFSMLPVGWKVHENSCVRCAHFYNGINLEIHFSKPCSNARNIIESGSCPYEYERAQGPLAQMDVTEIWHFIHVIWAAFGINYFFSNTQSNKNAFIRLKFCSEYHPPTLFNNKSIHSFATIISHNSPYWHHVWCKKWHHDVTVLKCSR